MQIIPDTMSQEDADAVKLCKFIERLVPLTKRYKKAANREYYGDSRSRNLNSVECRNELLTHLFSLTDGGAWLARVRVSHEEYVQSLAVREKAERSAK